MVPHANVHLLTSLRKVYTTSDSATGRAHTTLPAHMSRRDSAHNGMGGPEVSQPPDWKVEKAIEMHRIYWSTAHRITIMA
jgi:hypothetical protein